MSKLILIGLLLAFSLAKEDIWVKDEKFDPLAPFEFSRVVLYSPKGCTLDTMPGVSPKSTHLLSSKNG